MTRVELASAARAARPASGRAKTAWVLTLASVASIMVVLDILVVTTALATIRHDLKASASALEWTVEAYKVAFAALLLTGAALGDHYGRRRMFALGLTVVAAASAGCAVSWQWIFWVNVPVGIAAGVLVLAKLDESYGAKTPLDLPGMTLASGAILGGVWGLVRGNDLGWSNPQIVAAVCAGAVRDRQPLSRPRDQHETLSELSGW